jgi:CheY-specific phosphatase CheX
MSHLNFYKAGTIGGTDGTLVTSVNLNSANRILHNMEMGIKV